MILGSMVLACQHPKESQSYDIVFQYNVQVCGNTLGVSKLGQVLTVQCDSHAQSDIFDLVR